MIRTVCSKNMRWNICRFALAPTHETDGRGINRGRPAISPLSQSLLSFFPMSSMRQTNLQDIKLAQDSSSMELNRSRRSGVPTTPPPSKPAPSPRYNDLTRPSSLLVHKGSRTESNAGGARSPFFHGTANAVYPGVVRKSTDTKFDSLLPSQGSITVPEGDDEIVNAAQAWMAQLLYEEDDIRSFEVGCFPESLTDGRILCHLANRISPGCVERIHDDDSGRSQAKNILSFVEACRGFGVPEGTLVKMRSSKPKDVALSLHVLSYVIRDTVPTFRGPFLGQSSTATSSSTSTSSDDTTMIDAIQAAKGRDERHDLEQVKLSARVRQDFPDAAKAQQLGVRLESSPTFSPPANSYGAGAERCRGSLSPEGPARDTTESLTLQDMMSNRPLSLPARLQGTPCGSFASPRGATTTGNAPVTPASPMPWSRLPSIYSADSQSVLHQPRASTTMSATPDNELSTWLLNLNLRAFEVALVAIGVETVGDLRYVEEDDLATIGMHGPQIRKFMQNRPPVEDDI